MRKESPQLDWSIASWTGNREAQLAATVAATPAQRLAWLEEAIRFAHQVEVSRGARIRPL